MKLRSLQEWLSGIVEVADTDCMLSSISSDSRDMEAGAAFLAYPGSTVDGRDYIVQAIEKGAAAVIYEPPLDHNAMLQATDVPLIPIPQLAQQRGQLAARFYGTPSTKMTTIGVTGTNGKTSCVDFIAQAFAARDSLCGVIGTLGVGIWPELKATGMTTVDAVQLQQSLFQLHRAGATCAAMEVSSHGLSSGRLSATEIDIAVFTQLSRDHLDFHGNMIAYQRAKMSLFQQPGLRAAVVNVDDDCGKKIVTQYGRRLSMVGVSLQQQKRSSIPMIYASEVLALVNGFELQVHSPWGEGLIFIPLLGKFNIYNVLLVLGVLGSLGWSWQQMMTVVPRLQPVIGRMQCLGGGNMPLVVVDYAHTPDALEQVMLSLKAHCEGKLWCVFGCGGDRDVGKRPLMAQAVERHADHIIVTNDNPRSESPRQIAADISAGFKLSTDANTVLSRQEAIAIAIQSAAMSDVIVVAGKGHESTQIIADRILPFSDVSVVKEQLTAREDYV